MAKHLSRQELYDLVWSTPMKTLAAQFGLSDVGLKKTCARATIPTPDRGYWAKREAGKETIQVALPKREPGMSDEVVVARGINYWHHNWTEDELLGPLPSPPKFPESIESVRERIAKVIGIVTVPQKVKGWHPWRGCKRSDHIDLAVGSAIRRRQSRISASGPGWLHGSRNDINDP